MQTQASASSRISLPSFIGRCGRYLLPSMKSGAQAAAVVAAGALMLGAAEQADASIPGSGDGCPPGAWCHPGGIAPGVMSDSDTDAVNDALNTSMGQQDGGCIANPEACIGQAGYWLFKKIACATANYPAHMVDAACGGSGGGGSTGGGTTGGASAGGTTGGTTGGDTAGGGSTTGGTTTGGTTGGTTTGGGTGGTTGGSTGGNEGSTPQFYNPPGSAYLTFGVRSTRLKSKYYELSSKAKAGSRITIGSGRNAQSCQFKAWLRDPKGRKGDFMTACTAPDGRVAFIVGTRDGVGLATIRR